MFVGDRSYYKNFSIAVELAAKYPDFKLVIVGGKEIDNNEKVFLEKKISGRFLHFRGCSNEELNCLYNFSFGLIYPSCYEGFGIPVIEAMKAGCPVIAQNVSSLPEVCGEAGLMVDSNDISNYIDKFEMLFNEDKRNHIIDMGYKQAKKFSWDKCFKETIEFYNDIYES